MGLLTIALDYDDTYTVDPELWDGFITTALARGHLIHIVTARNTDQLDDIEINLPIHATSGQPKAAHMRSVGVDVDVWIDDWPELIGRTRV